ncbi:hypothetical protein Tco_1526293, partial [Tanacetum coccineum]
MVRPENVNTTIREILLAKKLSGSNFTNWYGNLRIVLRYEKKIKFVEQPTRPAYDPETADLDTIDKYYETVKLERKGLRESRKLKHRALRLYMGNGMRAAVEAIGSFDLILPTGVIIVLD